MFGDYYVYTRVNVDSLQPCTLATQERYIMKMEKLNAHLRADPLWEDGNVKNYLVKSLTIVDDDGQVRAGGIVSSHVEALCEDILQRGQLCPITIDENNVVVEGNHRVKAVQALSRRHPANPRWQRVRAYQRSFKNEAERRAYQLECNAHVPAKASTSADYAQVVRADLEAGMVPGIVWRSFNDDSKNFTGLVDYVRDAYKKYGIGKAKAKAIAKIAASDAPNAKVKNYTKEELIREFDESNCIDWSGKKSGDDSNGVSIYAVGNLSHVFPNLTGNSFKKKTGNDQLETAAVIWQSNTFGIQGKDLDKFRHELVERVNKANKSWLLKDKAKLVDEVFVAPQKLREGKENTKKFYRVRKKSNGEFDVSSIPTSGWK